MVDFAQRRFLIVGGVPRGGTTSLFHILGQHPQIVASSMKEPRFFLDEPWNVLRRVCVYEDGLARYARFFAHADPDAVLMEASPFYVYSDAAAQRIAKDLPHARVVLSLRDPVQRLISWYRLCVQEGVVPGTLSPDAYVEARLAGAEGARAYPPDSVKAGCYVEGVRRYHAALGPERVRVVFSEAMAENTLQVIEDLCRFAGVDPAPCGTFDLRPRGQSDMGRRPFLRRLRNVARYTMSRLTYRFPTVHRRLQGAVRHMEGRRPAPRGSRVGGTFSEDTVARLRAFYHADAVALSEELGCAIPWVTT